MAETRKVTIEEIKSDPMELMNVLVRLLDGLDEPMLGAFIGVAVDQCMANMGKTSEETLELFKGIYETAKKAHEVLGMPSRMEY